MCDSITETENETYLQSRTFSRREAGLTTGVTLAAVFSGCSPTAVPDPVQAAATPEPPEVNAGESHAADGRMVSITTPDGVAEGFFAAPKSGSHPGVLVWPDVAGLRDAYRTMATRLANEGYAVLVVNPYYRSAQLPIVKEFAEWRTEEGQAKIRPLRAELTADAIARDGAAFVAWLDEQSQVDRTKKLATTGYCMGGPFTVRTAAAAPERVGVVGSFHGGGLVTEEANSPHRLLAETQVAALICIAQNDDARDPEAKNTLRAAAEAAGVPAEIEVYPAQHGWCAIDSPVYDDAQAERAWARMVSTFQRHL
jgi:carboxymethylenebutenolidase